MSPSYLFRLSHPFDKSPVDIPEDRAGLGAGPQASILGLGGGRGGSFFVQQLGLWRAYGRDMKSLLLQNIEQVRAQYMDGMILSSHQ